jgi:hypothetical protein
MTYGTGISTAIAGTVGEPLMLPDRHGGLQHVDQLPARVEGVGPVRAGHRGHHGQLADGQVAGAVHDGDTQDALELLRDQPGDPAQFGLGGRVRAVGQAGHALVVVAVPDRSGEQRDAARAGARDRGPDLVDGQFGIPDGDQPHDVHLARLPGRPRKSSDR